MITCRAINGINDPSVRRRLYLIVILFTDYTVRRNFSSIRERINISASQSVFVTRVPSGLASVRIEEGSREFMISAASLVMVLVKEQNSSNVNSILEMTELQLILKVAEAKKH